MDYHYSGFNTQLPFYQLSHAEGYPSSFKCFPFGTNPAAWHSVAQDKNKAVDIYKVDESHICAFLSTKGVGVNNKSVTPSQ